MVSSTSEKNILVAPLNWGLGHATRCIPIIKELQKNGFTPILASDGVALSLLKKEFPKLIALELPSYNIEYAENGANFKWKMLKNMPKMMDAILNEKRIVKGWVIEYNLIGIISDNRLGVFNKKIQVAVSLKIIFIYKTIFRYITFYIRCAKINRDTF